MAFMKKKQILRLLPFPPRDRQHVHICNYTEKIQLYPDS